VRLTAHRCRVGPLDGGHDKASFSCGVEALDRYLKTQASQDIRRRLASCFVLTPAEEPTRIVGYYTLSPTSIALTDLPARIVKRLPRYPAVGATLMGRLAVDSRCQGARLGEFLMLDAMARALKSEITPFAFVVDPKDEAAAKFYARFEFLPLPGGGKRLFLPMTEIAKALFP
jgi:predicted N-acetyltransferase YhbS